MSSLSDIFTVSKNIAVAINNVAQTYLKVQGAKRSDTLTTTALVTSGQGRLASVSVVVAGSSDGMIYDSSASGTLVNALAVIDSTLGVHVLNLPYNNGLVVVPGTGMTVVATYSEG
jgi:hypothetical protein